jgi:hypothetical protein
MDNVINIGFVNQTRYFTEDEAYRLLSFMLAITNKTKNEINALNSQMNFFKGQPIKSDEVQFKLNEVMQKWAEKVKRLGGIPLGLYKVQIPETTKQSWLWEYPSAELVKN